MKMCAKPTKVDISKENFSVVETDFMTKYRDIPEIKVLLSILVKYHSFLSNV
jgi:hypothetical protein